MSNTYELRLKQNSCQYISPWKISSFLDDLASNYYKKFLLNLILERIDNLDENQNLIIFDKSFDLYQKYINLEDFSLENADDIKNIYFLGNPLSLKPNLILTKISLIFKLHRSLFTELNSIDILMDREKIIEYINVNYNEEEKFNFNSIETYLKELLDLKNKQHEKVFNTCKKVLKTAEEKLEEYIIDSVAMEIIEDFDDESEFEEHISNNDNKRLYKKYFKSFEESFDSLERPVVGIIDIKNKKLSILAKEFIREDLQEKNTQKIEMIGLKRNSPVLMDFITGAIVVSWLIQTVITQLETRKIEEIKNNNISDEETNPEIIRFNKLIGKYNVIKSSEDNLDKKIVSMKDFKVRKSFFRMNKEINKNTNSTLDKNGFLNSRIEIKPVEENDNNSE